MSYDASAIDILEGVDAVRHRPGMYIGETNRNGLHHLIYEILDNSVDEAIAGYCNEIKVTFYPEDNSIEIIDNGRGVPVDIHPDKGISAATILFTVLHAGGKFHNKDAKSAYKTAGGLHGVGATVTNALSNYLEITVRKNGKVYFQRFEKGHAVDILKEVRDMTPEEVHGTAVRFSPDASIFPEALEEDGGIKLSADYLRDRIKRTTYLTKKLRFILKDENGVTKEYYSENGISDLVSEQANNLAESIKVEQEKHGNFDYQPNFFEEHIRVECSDDFSSFYICFNYVNNYFKSNVLSFTNNIFTELGGTHVRGFENALKASLINWATAKGKIKTVFTIEDILEGINAVISYSTQDPKFSDQTKKKLSYGEAQKLIYAQFKEFLDTFLDKNPSQAELWVDRIILAQRNRERAEKEQQAFRREQTIGGLGAPAKLADCQSKKAEECELYLVEGDSAGGSAKQARDRKFQAILPLKGKILNISKVSNNKKITDSQEIKSLVSALKCGTRDDFNYDKLRYHKIIIMTDADVDGAHIATLFLNFFLRETPELVKKGHIYLAMPPLYVLKRKDESIYFADKIALDNAYPNGVPSSYSLQRFKGLGEMDPKQLWATTMNPKTRNLMQVQFTEDNSEQILQIFEDLMGIEVERRKEFIMQNSKKADLDI
jgi:DNA gyrase subunit B